MRALALVLSLLACMAAPAFAQYDPTGISGHVVDADTKKPLAGAEVAIYRMPMERATVALHTLHTDKHGFFSTIWMEPGRYVIMATADGLRAACATTDLVSNVVGRIQIEMSKDHEVCIGKQVQNALVLPGQTADVYVIH